jgi:3-phenylpropionate/trans-cinnamate dioxygenase ferredoxin subunit
MADFIDVASTNDVPEGTLRKVTAGGHELVVARIEQKYFCADNACPHLAGDLSSGTLHGYILTCPMHHSQFDLRDGHVVRWTDLTGIKLALATNQRPPRPLRTYPVQVEGTRVLVKT